MLNKFRMDDVGMALSENGLVLELILKSFMTGLLIVLSGCAASGQNNISEPQECVEAPIATAKIKDKAEFAGIECDDEHTVAQKVDALRERHASGELDSDQLYTEQAAIIDGACFKAYLPLVEDDMTPMGPGPAMRLRKLKSLLEAGIVDEAEYQAKKRQILEVL